jgi:uncharacterized protein with HEPN domain
MKRTDPFLLADILDAIDEIQETVPSERKMFHANKLVQSHVLRHIQIVGEAANRLSDGLKDQHSHVPWRAIAGMRHAIVHDYFEIDWDEVFDTAIRDIPPLRQQIHDILYAIEPDMIDGDESKGDL